jgi:CRP/FNR family transcriptional regulator, cyclic AMP receptor protein
MTVAPEGASDSETLTTLLSERPRRRFATGSRLFHEGERPVEAFFIRDGLVKLVKTAEDGAESVLEFRGPGCLVGDLSVVADLPRITSAVAATPLTVTSIPRDQLVTWIPRDADLALAMLATTARSVRYALEHVLELRIADPASLVATRLMELVRDPTFDSLRANRDGTIDIEMPMTQEELASWAGVSHRSVANVLQQLRAENLISTSRYHLAVRDPAGLASRCTRTTSR